MARSIRQLARFMLPYWARDDEAGGALHYALALLIDADLWRLRRGVEQRFPSRAGTSALALIGRDRLIPRGRDETDAHYAARLRAWRYPRGHRVRGSVFALLEQIAEYFGGGFRLYGIDRSGNQRERAADGSESYARGVAWTWDTGAASRWARQWIVLDGSTLFEPQPDLGDPELWGGAFGAPGHCVGVRGASAEDWNAVRALFCGPHRWLPAGTQGEWLIVSLDGAEPEPDATWAKWGKLDGGAYVPARSSSCRYVALRPALCEYAGDSDVAASVTSDLGTFTGDDSQFPPTITLPDGREYAGDPTVFSGTITLPDDGSLPA